MAISQEDIIVISSASTNQVTLEIVIELCETTADAVTDVGMSSV